MPKKINANIIFIYNPKNIHTKFIPMLGNFQMLTQFSNQFSQWEPIDTFKCDNWIQNWPQVLTWPRTCYDNHFKCIHFIFFEELDKFSHGT
jgi:hypothetical protein